MGGEDEMRKWFILFAALVASPALASGDSPEGLWRTEPVKSGAFVDVRIAPCGAAYCGVIEAAYNTVHKDLVGEQLISGMVPDGPDRWASGKIVAPDTNKTYDGSLSLEGESLRVRGCLAMICRSQVWTRLN
jgi:uncharacterized protein (DUF2147 family)